MKIFFWIYVGLFILTSPLFIYDMYVERSVHLTYIAAFLLIFVFYKQTFKEENTGKGGQDGNS